VKRGLTRRYSAACVEQSVRFDLHLGQTLFGDLIKLISNQTQTVKLWTLTTSNLSVIKLKLHLFDLLWICCGFVVQLFDLLYSFSIRCGQVESHTPLFRFVVDLL
jgi:hypothetical protein